MWKWNGKICRKVLLLLAVNVSTLALAHAESSEREADDLGLEKIIGGTDVPASDSIATSTVLLVGKLREGQYICTGSLIAPDIIVTAAHCVTAPAADMRVVFALAVGPNNKPDPSRVFPVAGYTPNPNYKGEHFQGSDMGDIAVIRIKRPLPNGYAPAALLPPTANLSAGQNAVLAGFGITSAATQAGAGTLRRTSALIQGPAGKTEVVVDESHQHGSCSGDSGGPAFVQVDGKLVLWGVTSRGDVDCSRQGVYTRIGAYTDWLASASAELRSQP